MRGASILSSQSGRVSGVAEPSVGAGAARARDKGCPTRPKRMSRDRWAWQRAGTVVPPAAVALPRRAKSALRGVILVPLLTPKPAVRPSARAPTTTESWGGVLEGSSVIPSRSRARRPTKSSSPKVSAHCSSDLAIGIAASLHARRLRSLRSASSPAGSASAALVVKHAGRRIPIVSRTSRARPSGAPVARIASKRTECRGGMSSYLRKSTKRTAAPRSSSRERDLWLSPYGQPDALRSSKRDRAQQRAKDRQRAQRIAQKTEAAARERARHRALVATVATYAFSLDAPPFSLPILGDVPSGLPAPRFPPERIPLYCRKISRSSIATTLRKCCPLRKKVLQSWKS